jgi:hypothetical protein
MNTTNDYTRITLELFLKIKYITKAQLFYF